jgi:uncharacterized membrane protein
MNKRAGRAFAGVLIVCFAFACLFVVVGVGWALDYVKAQYGSPAAVAAVFFVFCALAAAYGALLPVEDDALRHDAS